MVTGRLLCVCTTSPPRNSSIYQTRRATVITGSEADIRGLQVLKSEAVRGRRPPVIEREKRRQLRADRWWRRSAGRVHAEDGAEEPWWRVITEDGGKFTNSISSNLWAAAAADGGGGPHPAASGPREGGSLQTSATLFLCVPQKLSSPLFISHSPEPAVIHVYREGVFLWSGIVSVLTGIEAFDYIISASEATSSTAERYSMVAGVRAWKQIWIERNYFSYFESINNLIYYSVHCINLLGPPENPTTHSSRGFYFDMTGSRCLFVCVFVRIPTFLLYLSDNCTQ